MTCPDFFTLMNWKNRYSNPKVGMKVKYIKYILGNVTDLKIGSIGEITHIFGDTTIDVLFGTRVINLLVGEWELV